MSEKMITWFEVTQTVILLVVGGVLVICPRSIAKKEFQDRVDVRKLRIAGTVILVALCVVWILPQLIMRWK